MSRILTINELPEDVPEEYKKVKDAIWFVIYQTDWIGFGGLQFHMEHPYFGPTFIKPEFRGLGLQRVLIAARINYCKRRGNKKVCTIVDYDNIFSRNNVEKMNFKPIRNNAGEIYYELTI